MVDLHAARKRQPGAGAAVTVERPAISVECFTDPLCSWSWAQEPIWRQIRARFGPALSWRWRMGGMIESWTAYSDPIQSISRPAQMAPQWFEVRRQTGVPIDERIWLSDPPASSYLPCLAVKAAQRQSLAIGEQLLQRLWRAVMVECRNIALPPTIADLASDIAELDIETLKSDLESPAVRESLQADLAAAAYRRIGRFPTLLVRGADRREIMFVGWRPRDVLLSTFQRWFMQPRPEGT